jgi:hypothetical protein
MGQAKNTMENRAAKRWDTDLYNISENIWLSKRSNLHHCISFTTDQKVDSQVSDNVRFPAIDANDTSNVSSKNKHNEIHQLPFRDFSGNNAAPAHTVATYSTIRYRPSHRSPHARNIDPKFFERLSTPRTPKMPLLPPEIMEKPNIGPVKAELFERLHSERPRHEMQLPEAMFSKAPPPPAPKGFFDRLAMPKVRFDKKGDVLPSEGEKELEKRGEAKKPTSGDIKRLATPRYIVVWKEDKKKSKNKKEGFDEDGMDAHDEGEEEYQEEEEEEETEEVAHETVIKTASKTELMVSNEGSKGTENGNETMDNVAAADESVKQEDVEVQEATTTAEAQQEVTPTDANNDASGLPGDSEVAQENTEVVPTREQEAELAQVEETAPSDATPQENEAIHAYDDSAAEASASAEKEDQSDAKEPAEPSNVEEPAPELEHGENGDGVPENQEVQEANATDAVVIESTVAETAVGEIPIQEAAIVDEAPEETDETSADMPEPVSEGKKPFT